MLDLNRLLRSTVKGCLSAGPLPVWIQALRTRRCLGVLTYHSVIDEPLPFYDWSFLDTSVFRRQLSYLKEHFSILPLSEAIVRLGDDTLEGPTVAITFDDGFADNFKVAFPLLQEYQAPATIYLATDLIGSRRTVWFTRLILALQATDGQSLIWDGAVYPLGSPEQRARTSARLQSTLKRFPAPKLLEELALIESRLSVPQDPLLPEDSAFRMLDAGMIRSMQDSGLVEFGAHTCGHTILSRLPDAEKAVQIKASIRQVEELTGRKCRTFAYPNGAPSDFDSYSQGVLAEAGIEAALTMVPGPNRPTTHVMEMHRYPVGADTDFSRFKLMVHNVA